MGRLARCICRPGGIASKLRADPESNVRRVDRRAAGELGASLLQARQTGAAELQLRFAHQLAAGVERGGHALALGNLALALKQDDQARQAYEEALQLAGPAPSFLGFSAELNLAWQMPLAALGLANTQLSLAAESGSSSVIEEPVRLLDIRSKLSSRDIGLSHRLLESLSQSLTLGLNGVSRSNRTELLGEPFSFTPGVPDGLTRETLWRFWQSYDWCSERQVLALR